MSAGINHSTTHMQMKVCFSTNHSTFAQEWREIKVWVCPNHRLAYLALDTAILLLAHQAKNLDFLKLFPAHVQFLTCYTTDRPEGAASLRPTC